MLGKDFTFTKRQLGIIFIIGGILGIVGILAIDLLDAGREGGIGPAQQLALGIMAFTVIIGITLLPLGDQPA